MTHSLSPEYLSSPAPELAAILARLEDPTVAAGLHNLLDHVDLLAILVVGLDKMVARSEVIGDALVEGVAEIRSAAGDAGPTEPFDIAALLNSLVALSAALPKLTPGLTRVAEADLIDDVIDSGIVSHDSMQQIGMLGRALTAGAAAAESEPLQIKGALSMLRHLRDPDVARGLGYTLNILKAVGRELGSDH